MIRHPLQWKAAIPHAVLLLWVIYLGFMIWQHDVKSLQPPLYDSLSYMQKAMNFWSAVESGKPFNPLNLDPTSRPPGTILMSFPVGFSPSSEGIHFRSVFFSILCVILAVYVAAGAPRNTALGWGTAAAAFLFSAVPMFYIFDLNENNPKTSYWGLVDTFQAGVASLACAGFVRSFRKYSLSWVLFGALLASFTLLVKPSGLMVMALLAATWLTAAGITCFWARKQGLLLSRLYRFVIFGGILVFLLYSSVVFLCYFSKYFSAHNFSYAKQALGIMAEVLKVPLSQMIALVIDSAGIPMILWILGNALILVFCFVVFKERRNSLSPNLLVFPMAIPVIWTLGAWYWAFVQAGGNQVRYFFPFLLMGAICMIPSFLHIFKNSGRWIRTGQLLVCFLPALNIGALLALDSPPVPWQKHSGVNVLVGEDREEVNQAYAFLNELRRRNTSVNLYSLSASILPDIFVNVGLYEKMVRPDLPAFHPTLSVDWVRGFVVRTHEMLDADFLLMRKDLDQQAKWLVKKPIDTFHSECIVFQAWLCGLNENYGLKTISDGRVLRVVEIVDKKAFSKALESFVAAHTWRPAFLEENARRQWSNEADVSASVKDPAARGIGFDGIYKMHLLSLRESVKGLHVEIWWEELRHEEENNHRHMFFHLVDHSGKILRDLYLPLNSYDPPFDDQRWRYGSVTFEQPLPEGASSLAFGVFRPNDETLIADKGNRDWGGKRVLIPIPCSPEGQTMK